MPDERTNPRVSFEMMMAAKAASTRISAPLWDMAPMCLRVKTSSGEEPQAHQASLRA
jgi:hypothetical protein